MATGDLRHSILRGPRLVGEITESTGLQIGLTALGAARRSTLVQGLVGRIDGLIGEMGASDRLVTRLQAQRIGHELTVSRSGIIAASKDESRAAVVARKPKKERTAEDIELQRRALVAPGFKRLNVLRAGKIIAAGFEPTITDYPHPTEQDIDHFIAVADMVYPQVTQERTIDPPLIPVGYDEQTFDVLRWATTRRLEG